MLRGCNKKEWFTRVEACTLDVASLGCFAKRLLRTGLAKLMNQDRRSCSLGTDSDEIVTLAMPADVGDLLVRAKETDGTCCTAEGTDRLRGGCPSLLFYRRPGDGLGRLEILGIASTLAGSGSTQQRFIEIRIVGTTGSCRNHNRALTNSGEKAVMSTIWIPFQRHDRLGLIAGLGFRLFLFLVIVAATGRFAINQRRHIPRSQKSARLYFPESNVSIASSTGKELTVGTDRKATDHRRLLSLGNRGFVPHSPGRREGSKIGRPRDRGYQTLRVDVQSTLHGTGTQVQIQAALKPLADTVSVGSHRSKVGMLLGDEQTVGTVLDVHLGPLLEIFFSGQIFVGRDVRFGVARRRRLGRGNVLRSLAQGEFVLLVTLPQKSGCVGHLVVLFQVVHIADLALEEVHVDRTALEPVEETTNLQLLPLGGLEACLGLVAVGIDARYLLVNA
mmetsp:Transcript_32902/g.97068  ORF Transcript_32902/g.97068 Transcript_32902/m.97068 type:complete len:446 (-) Transcript_32902:969-2306(-)